MGTLINSFGQATNGWERAVGADIPRVTDIHTYACNSLIGVLVRLPDRIRCISAHQSKDLDEPDLSEPSNLPIREGRRA